jgi:hypothetical protein
MLDHVHFVNFPKAREFIYCTAQFDLIFKFSKYTSILDGHYLKITLHEEMHTICSIYLTRVYNVCPKYFSIYPVNIKSYLQLYLANHVRCSCSLVWTKIEQLNVFDLF